MFIKTFWYWFCIFILLTGLHDLLVSKDEITFRSDAIGNLNTSDDFRVSVCLQINSTFYDCTNLTENLKVCESLRKYFKYVEGNENKSPKEIIQRFNKSKDISTLFDFDKAEEEKGKYLNLNQLCIIYKLNVSQSEMNNDKRHLSFNLTNKYHISLNLFIHSKIFHRYQRYEYLDCKNFKDCHYFSFTMKKYSRVLLPSPFKSNCKNYSNLNFFFKRFEEIDSVPACLQECLKIKNRLSEFFYTENDTDLLKFNKSGNHDLIDRNHFKMCRNKCQSGSCLFNSFSFITKFYMAKNNNHVEIKIDKRMFIFEAIPRMDEFTFWRRFLALFSLFFKISILSLILKLKDNLNKFLKNDTSALIIGIVLGLILIFCLYYLSHLGESIYNEFDKKALSSFLYLQIPFIPLNLSIAICKNINTDEYRNQSVFNYLKPANIFNSTKSFKIRFADEEKEFNSLNSGKFFYKISENKLEHCFAINVFVQEQRYRSLMSFTTLIIKKEPAFDTIYVEQYNKSFTYHSFKLEYNSKIDSLDINYENNCSDYKFNDNEKLCDSKLNCFDKCLNEEFLKAFNKLPRKTLVYLDDYEEHLQKFLYIDFNKSANDTDWLRLVNKCENKTKEKNCKSTQLFSDSFAGLIANNDTAKNDFKVDLFYLQFKIGNKLKFNLFKTICCFVTLSTITIGLNWPKLSATLIKLINFNLKPEDKLNFKNLIFLVSLIGFTLHSYFIFDQTCVKNMQINSDHHFLMSQSNKKIPELVICLKHNATFENYEIRTGFLLEEKTNWINKSYLFKQIVYYDLDFKKQIWTSSANFSENFKIFKFFLLDYKCFVLQYFLDINHPKNLVINTILHIKFNLNLNHTNYFVTSKGKRLFYLSIWLI